MQTDNQFGHVGIIGAGELGRALGQSLTQLRVQVIYYDKDPKRTTTGSIEDVVRSCPTLLMCVPSWEMKAALKQLAHASQPNEQRVVMCFAKGIAEGFVTMDRLLADNAPKNYIYGAMYGPMIAEEILHGHPANAVVALSNNSAFQEIRRLFNAAQIYVEASSDMQGIALCAALKNVYAIAFGIADGMRLGLNAKGRLAVVALAELKQLLADLGAKPSTAEGTAGLGDLLSTVLSPDSFNYSIGKTLAEGIASEHIKSEGIVALYELGRKVKLARYPILNAVHQISFHYGQPQKIQELLC